MENELPLSEKEGKIPKMNISDYFSSRYEEEMEATRSSFSLEDVIEYKIRDNEEVIGKLTFLDSGEVMEYTSKENYLNALKSELDSHGVTGTFKYETVKRSPELLKEVDDIIYGEYGEGNPNSLEYYKEKYKNIEQQDNNKNPKMMETKTEFNQSDYLKSQMKYLGFGEDEKLHKDLEKGIKSKKQQFEIKTTSDKTLPGNKADFTLKFNKTENGGVFLNSYDAKLTTEKGEEISHNFRVNRDSSFTAKEAVNLMEGRSVKIEFHNPKSDQQETAFVQFNFDEPKTEKGNYLFRNFYQNYGVDTDKIVEKSNLIFDKPEYRENTIKSLEKGNVVKVKFDLNESVMEGKAILDPQNRNLKLYDNDLNRLNTNKPLEGLEQDNKHEKNNVREQGKSRSL